MEGGLLFANLKYSFAFLHVSVMVFFSYTGLISTVLKSRKFRILLKVFCDKSGPFLTHGKTALPPEKEGHQGPVGNGSP